MSTPPIRENGYHLGPSDNTVFVSAYGAKGDGTTDDTAAIQAAVAAWTAAGSGALVFPSGTYKYSTGITFPMVANGRLAIQLDAGATLNYTGTGYAIEALGSGTSQANVTIKGGSITGSSAGLAGIHLRAFSQGRIDGVNISGFTNGDGIFNEGANTVDIIGCRIVGNKNGYHSVAVVVSATNFAPNANRIIGGHIASNTQWGVFEDGSVTAPGPAINNTYATTIETNGSGASGGNVFIQQGTGIVISSYFEYTAGAYGPYQIAIGDATYHPTSTVVRNCLFGSVNATASVYDNGFGTVIDGNTETGSITSFIVGGTNGTGRFIGKNRAAAVTNVFTGTDSGDTLDVGSSTGLLASMYGSALGIAVRSLSGQTTAMILRARSVSDNTAYDVQDESGNRIFSIDKRGHFVGGGTAPSVAVGNAAQLGTGPSASLSSGTDIGSTVSVSTGTTPSAFVANTPITMATVTFGGTQWVSPRCAVVYPANAAAARAVSSGVVFYVDQASTTTGQFVIKANSNSTPTFQASTAMQLAVVVVS